MMGELCDECGDEYLRSFTGLGIGLGAADSPDRRRPGGVVGKSSDHVNVQLGDDVTERCHVDFLRACYPFERAGSRADFLVQHCLPVCRHGVQFTQILYARHQNAPGKAPVVHQQKVAKGKLSDRQAVLSQFRMQRKGHSIAVHTIAALIDSQTDVVDQEFSAAQRSPTMR